MTTLGSGWAIGGEGLDLPDALKGSRGSSLSSSILTPLESDSKDFESKNGIRESELTIIYSGWGLRDEGLDPSKEVPVEGLLFHQKVDFDRIGVCFRRF